MKIGLLRKTSWPQVVTSNVASCLEIPVKASRLVNLALACSNRLHLKSNSTVIAALLVLLFCRQASGQAPSITSLSPASGPIGTFVTITGSGFGASQGSSTVALNGAAAPVWSWSDTTIVGSVPSGASSGTFSVTANGQVASSTTFTVVPLPAGSSDTDVGSVGLAGSATYASGVFTLKGAGAGITGTADGMHFVYQPLSGDGTIVARVVSSSSSSQAGVMIRETLNANATDAYAISQPYYSNLQFFYRASTGASATGSTANSVSLPAWVKVVRSGNAFSGYRSSDGVNWTQIGSTQTITMAQNAYVGLVVSSQSTSSLATATFDNVSISSTASPAPTITGLSATTGSVGSQVVISGSGFGASQGSSAALLNGSPLTISTWSNSSIVATIPSGATSGPMVVSVAPGMNDSNPIVFTVTSQPLPTSWLDQDIGMVGVSGSATYASGVFTLKGAGAGITGTADGMHFVYQPLSGDGTIVARVVSSSSSSQAGVMIRETLNANATDAYAISQPYYSNLQFFYRASTGASATGSTANSVSLPAWVKLVRSGSSFSGYRSSDGVNWTQVGSSQTITMAQNAYVGLVVSSQSTSSLATATFDNVSVSNAPLSITTGSLSSGIQSLAYSASLAASGGAVPYTWSITAGSLPSGLSLNTSTGAINGTPTSAGTSNFTAQVTDAKSSSVSQTFSLSINAPLSVITASLPSGTQGAAYSVTLTATGGQTPYTWSISAGILPGGLSLNASTGTIAGTPTATGTNSFTAQVRDANSITATQAFSLNINPPPPLVVTTISFPSGTQNTAYSTALAATGGLTPYTWSISAASLPAGLSLNANTGSITGTPTAPLTSSFTVQVKDANSNTASEALSIIINPPLAISTSSLSSGMQNAAYSATLAASGGQTPYTWSISAGSLPSGLSLTASTGAISGTPTTSGSSSFTVKVTDSSSPANSTSEALSIIVNLPLTITTSSLPGSTQNVAYSATLTATGGATPYTWSISAGSLPAGVSLNASTGTIAGTSAAIGTTSLTVQVSDANASTATRTLNFTTLPSSWSDADIGPIGSTGSVAFSNGIFTVNGAGTIGSTSDTFHFVYQSLSGDGSIVARVASVQGAGYRDAGVMIRETLSPSSSDAFINWQPNTACFYTRTSTGASTPCQPSYGYSGPATPYWVKLVRSGNTISAYIASDGFGYDWQQVGTSTTFTMAQNVYIGLAVASAWGSTLFDNVSISSAAAPAPVINGLSASTASVGSQVVASGSGFGSVQDVSMLTLNGAPVTVTSWSDTQIVFTVPGGATSGLLSAVVAPVMNASNPVYLEVTTQPLPTSWMDTDIGLVGSTGSATFANGTFTVTGAGAIGGTSDKLHFVYQALLGDGSIVARVASKQGAVQVVAMIRETLSPSSSDAFLYWNPNTAYFVTRPSTGASTTSQTGSNYSGPATPYWVKLIRNLDTFAAYLSSDGSRWQQVGTSTTISMAQNVYIGLAVDSGTATFDNVSVTAGTTPIIAPPTISSVSPATGGVGSSVTITGTNFGDTPATSTVTFNGAAASAVTTWNNSQIIATVPVTATTGPVQVVVSGIASNTTVTFTVPGPRVTSVSPTGGPVGTQVTITGSGFQSAQRDSTAAFNDATASVVSWSDTQIVTTVPAGAKSGPVTVFVNSVTSNSSIAFTVPPIIAGASPASAPVGSMITIVGTNFGAVQGGSTVNFNGTSATVSSWSNTQIVAAVPTAATTGPITVQVSGFVSNQSATFAVVPRVAGLTDSAGNQSTYTSVVAGGTSYVSDVAGLGCSSCTMRGETHRTFDSNGNILSSTDALGHTTSYTYDSAGNMTSVSVPIDANTTATTTYSYNNFSEVLTTTDPLGNTTTNSYDANGNLLSVTSPAPDGNTPPSVSQFAYDSKGELITITDPLGHRTAMTYAPAGLVSTITDPQQKVTSYQYDLHGNRTAVIDALQNQTTFAYDTGDRLVSITYSDQTSVSFTYDSRGRRTSVTDQNSKTATYAYDDADRLVSVTDAAGHLTQYSYDAENKLLSITDGAGNVTSFAYDAYGRVTQTNFPSSVSEFYAYDVIGNRISKTDRKGQTISYVYDALNRITHKGYPDSSGADYVYDLVGKLKQVSDPTGTYGFAYDNMGRLIGTSTSYSFLPGQTFANTYTYDAASNRAGTVAPDGSTTVYNHDTLNRLSSLNSSFAGQFTFGYDVLGRRTSLMRPNGVSTSYQYDKLSHLLSLTHQASGATIDGAGYVYDNAGNRTAKGNFLDGSMEQYTYDSLYQLTQALRNNAVSEAYTYDNVGNRLTSVSVPSHTYNSSNQLNATSTANYAYDYNGNTTSKVAASGTTTYTWDYENRLVSASTAGGVVTFIYDPFGRRIAKQSASGNTYYLYDGANVVVDLNAAGAVIARYAQGAGIDEPLASSTATGVSYYEADGLGSITSLSGSAGIADTYTYKPFGITTATGTNSNRFRFTGREYDPETGLYYYRARYYDPSIGRFISEDPARLMGGANFYAYVGNNPGNLLDPLGLWGQQADHSHPSANCHFPSCFWYYGNWGGPGWTGGQWKPYEDLTPDEQAHLAPPIDAQDACYQQHDLCYSRARVKNKCSAHDSLSSYQEYLFDQNTAQCDFQLAKCLGHLADTHDPSYNPAAAASNLIFPIQGTWKNTEGEPNPASSSGPIRCSGINCLDNK